MNNIKEQISALVDGETSQFSESELSQLIERVLTDPVAKSQWTEMNRMKDTISADVHTVAPEGFSDRVMSALSVEPTVLAPVMDSPEPEDQPQPKSVLPAFLRPVAGLAIAATVAAVTVFSVDNFNFGSDVNTAPAEVAIDTSTTVSPLANEFVSTVKFTGEYQPEVTNWDEPNPQIQQQLNQYLVNHTEFSNMGNVQGMLPYARLAGYDSTDQ